MLEQGVDGLLAVSQIGARGGEDCRPWSASRRPDVLGAIDRSVERALVLTAELAEYRRRGDVTLEAQCTRTIDDLVGYWQAGRFVWPVAVAAAAGRADMRPAD